MAKTISRGLESQARSLFHMFLSTEYRFFIKSKILVLQGQNYPILSQDGPNLGPNDQNLIKRPREPNRPLFHMFLSTEYIFFMKILDLYFSGPKTGPKIA